MTRSCKRYHRAGHAKEFAAVGSGMIFATSRIRAPAGCVFKLARHQTPSTASMARRAPAIWYLQPKEGKESMFNPVILIAFSALILYFVLENLTTANEGQHSRC
jgi:hypothetical protein